MFSANLIKISSVKDYGKPFVRLVIDGGCVNPILGFGGNVEFPDLFGFLSASASLYWGPFSLSEDSSSRYSYTNVAGVRYYKVDILNGGFAGLYYGCKLGITLAKETPMEEERVTYFSEYLGYNLMRYFYFTVNAPVYYRHMIAAELTFEPIGSAVVRRIEQTYIDEDPETNYFINNATVGILKLMYQWESHMKYGVKYSYQLGNTTLGSLQNSITERYMKLFVGPMATLDFKGFGGYLGTEMGLDYLYVRLECGFVLYQDRPAYFPFKCNIGFYLPWYAGPPAELEKGAKEFEQS